MPSHAASVLNGFPEKSGVDLRWMIRSLSKHGMLGVGVLALGIAPWLLLPLLARLEPAREAVGIVTHLLRETRTRAILSGRPHRLLLSQDGGATTLEIRDQGESTPERTAALPGITLERGPAWIEVDPTGVLRTPAGYFRATLYQSWDWCVSSPPILWSDITLAASPTRRACLVLDDASGRVKESVLLLE